jgi:TonB-dependent SusC/RagA subfamily outer membrane receptor
MSLSNAPLIIVDGVRVESSENSLGFGCGRAGAVALERLEPDDIETVEVLRGPAAAALYGTAAANGVIQVTTRRGKAGAPAFRFWSEYGQLDQTVTFPVNTYATGQLVTAGNPNAGTGRCDIRASGYRDHSDGQQCRMRGHHADVHVQPPERLDH